MATPPLDLVSHIVHTAWPNGDGRILPHVCVMTLVAGLTQWRLNGAVHMLPCDCTTSQEDQQKIGSIFVTFYIVCLPKCI